jgi:hypothetical protein
MLVSMGLMFISVLSQRTSTTGKIGVPTVIYNMLIPGNIFSSSIMFRVVATLTLLAGT